MVLHPVKQFPFNREMGGPKSSGLKISNRVSSTSVGAISGREGL